MQADAHVDEAGLERVGKRRCRRECSERRGEREEERVSLRVHLHAALSHAGFADPQSVLGQHLRVGLSAQLVQELRRALDVREEEGDGAAGKVGAHGAIMRRRRRSV